VFTKVNLFSLYAFIRGGIAKGGGIGSKAVAEGQFNMRRSGVRKLMSALDLERFAVLCPKWESDMNSDDLRCGLTEFRTASTEFDRVQ
jgi:hypothetical protein